jgi:hypothetical protein
LSQSLTVRGPGHVADRHAPPLDARRQLQLALAVLWLLDGVLQYQPVMFTASFPQMLKAAAQGNPAFVASPVTWGAALIAHHEAVLNAVFATIQLALGLGIAFRPTVKPALAASVAWSLAVWWLGEGLGGLLAGTATPLAGAPGAVILYAVLAVLLWPADRADTPPFPAARAVGPRAARSGWLAVWGTLALLAVLPASQPSEHMAAGGPAWLASLDARAASVLGNRPLLAAILVLIAVGIYLPARRIRPVLVLAVALSVVLWLAQDLGGLLSGSATDPGSAPLLALLALAFWPSPRAS